MKIIETESQAGDQRLLLATNKEELLLLRAVIDTTLLHFPKTPRTTVDHSRLRVISKGLADALKKIKDKSNYKGKAGN